jgi:hypothetical protein
VRTHTGQGEGVELAQAGIGRPKAEPFIRNIASSKALAFAHRLAGVGAIFLQCKTRAGFGSRCLTRRRDRGR